MERGRAALRASRLSGRGRVCRYAVGVALWALSSVVSAFVPLTVRLLCAPLCAPVLLPGLEPAEQPLVSVWGGRLLWP
jgi:hypothetical protein